MKNRSQLSLFFLFIFLVLISLVWSCDADDDDDDNDDAAADDDDDNDDSGDDDDQPIEPVYPHREDYEGFTILWLSGTPYEMGKQQGELMMPELGLGIEWLDGIGWLDLLINVFDQMGFIELAYQNSYPDIVEECRGMSDAAGVVGWSMEICLLLNFGDVLVEFLAEGFPSAKDLQPGCTQFAATGQATTDGRLLHARSLDWGKIDFLLDYPVIHVRQPSDGLSHAFVGFPGNLSPYNGINTAGVVSASDEADPLDSTQHDLIGRSHVQLQAQIIMHAASFAEARQMIESVDHMTCELFMVSDAQQAAAFEMSATAVGVRELTDDVVYMTNHFIAPETVNCDADPVSDSSAKRLDRAAQLVAPDGEETHYGDLDLLTMIEILRDRVDPWSHEEYPADAFDNDGSIATNGAIYQMVFDPEKQWFWVAAGNTPVPQQPFVGFSLRRLLGYPDATEPEPLIIE